MEETKEESKIEAENHKTHHRKKEFTESIRKNPWMLSTIICGAVILVLFISILFGGNLSGKVVSSTEAGEKLVDFYNSVGITGITVTSIKEVSGLYNVTIDYQGQAVSLYITKDGKSIIETLVPTTIDTSSSSSSTTTEVPKSDKPIVELFVFTYCPYGLQMEKAMIPAVKLLGDKIEFKIRQIGAMHGAHEKLEAERQLCIEKNYPTKFLDYILAFAEDTSIGSCNGDATCLTPKLNALYTELGISASKIDSCISSEGESLYNAEVSNAESAGVSGSPTLIINGVTASSSRNPEAVKGAICEAFNSVPSECTQTLSTTSSSAGFGADAGSSTSASCWF